MSALYTKFKEALLTGAIDLTSVAVKAVAVDADDYTVNLATHQYLSDIPAAARVATSAALTGKTVSGGVFDADNATLTSASGDQFEAIVLFVDTGTEGTSPLIAYMNSATAGLPFTPDGGNVEIRWAAPGSYGIFAI